MENQKSGFQTICKLDYLFQENFLNKCYDQKLRRNSVLFLGQSNMVDNDHVTNCRSDLSSTEAQEVN